MKVTYEKTVVDKIYDAIALAKKDNKKIKEIELSPSEWREFQRGVFSTFNVVATASFAKTTTEFSCKFEGVTIKSSYMLGSPFGVVYGDL